MTRFVEEAVARGGLGPVLAARRIGDVEGLRRTLARWGGADLLLLGAVADLTRAEEIGDVVRIHAGGAARERASGSRDVTWVEARSDLDLLRAVAVARVLAPRGGRVGVDWSRHGLELAQVALGFGASDLRGPITRKSGLPILDHEARKVKGQGTVELTSMKRREIALLVQHAARVPAFVGEEGRPGGREARDEESTHA